MIVEGKSRTQNHSMVL